MRKLLSVFAMFVGAAAHGGDTWSFADEVRHIVAGQKAHTVAQAEYDAARERAKTKEWNFLPSVNATASRGQYVDRQDETTKTMATVVGADVSVNFFRFGADGASRRQAVESMKAAEFRRDAKVLAAETKAATALTDAIGAMKELAVYRQRMGTAQQAVAAAEARFKKGILSEQELAKLKLESSSLTLSLNAAERRAEQTLASVAAWGGVVAKDVLWPVSSHGSDKIKAWVRGLTPDTLSVKALESEASVADASTSVARSAMLPSVDLSGAWKKTLAEGTSGPLDHHEVVATLSVPLFNKFSDSGEYRARVQEAAAANAGLEAARAISQQEFKFAAIELIASIDEAKVRDEQIATADRLYRDNLQRFERGLITVNELSLDEHRVREAELAAIATWQRVHQELFHVAELAGQSVLSVL